MPHRSDLLQWMRLALPKGEPLPYPVWRQRHGTMLGILWLHALSIVTYAILTWGGDIHRLAECLTLIALAVGSSLSRHRRTQASLTSLGLVFCSALLVHFSGGYIELHFHFFVVIAIIALYQDWVPFLLAIGFVALHHGVLGGLDPRSIYNHPDAWENPWKWTAIHAGFVIAACAAGVVNWRLFESARTRSERAEQEVRALNATLEARVMERTASLARALTQVKEQVEKRKLAEAELATVNARRELDRITRDFVSTASHEFRTPLTAIAGFSELLLAQELSTPRQRQWIETMLREARRMSNLVEELLDLTRIEDGRIVISPVPVQLSEIVERALAPMEQTESRHRFVRRLPTDLPGVIVDPDKLVQILTNILSNAIKYSPEGGDVTVSARAEHGEVSIQISDQGLGMAGHEIASLFGRFNRVDAHADRGIKGSGLGLFITKRLVELHGGRIWAESQGTGQGSTFTFTLPIESPAHGRLPRHAELAP